MTPKLCPNNHYYDQSEHAQCPHCQAMAGAGAGGGAGIGVGIGGGADTGAYAGAGAYADQNIGATMPLSSPTPPAGVTDMRGDAPQSQNDGVTEIIIKEKIGLNPVVGWLVCIKGNDKGRDFRMHADYNYIGRGDNNDIVIRNDDTITRQKHAVVAYDTRDKAYYFGPSDGKGLVRVNGKAVLGSVELSSYDRIEIGKTILVFVPLCGEDFDWLVE